MPMFPRMADADVECGSLNSGDGVAPRPVIRVLALMEATHVSGPAKNLFQFVQTAREFPDGPIVQISIAMFRRMRKSASASEFVSAARRLQIPVHFIPERFLFDPGVVWRLRKLTRQIAPHILETHAVKSHFLLRASGLWKQCPWMAFHHGYTNIRFRSRFFNRLDLWSLRVPDQIVTVCEIFRKQLAQSGVLRDRINVLHNAVLATRRNADVAARKKAELGIPPEDRVILAVGRLSKEKGHFDLIKAMSHLARTRTEASWRLIILGDGPERQNIAHTIEQAGLNERVQLKGYCPQVSDYYQASDAVVISSLSEGSPNVLLEAMAVGVPVAATAVGGIPEMVTDGDTVLLVPPRDPEAMARAIACLLECESESKAMAERAYELVTNSYSPAIRTRSLLGLYMRSYRASILLSTNSYNQTG